jgi:hypothetical protein
VKRVLGGRAADKGAVVGEPDRVGVGGETGRDVHRGGAGAVDDEDMGELEEVVGGVGAGVEIETVGDARVGAGGVEGKPGAAGEEVAVGRRFGREGR